MTVIGAFGLGKDARVIVNGVTSVHLSPYSYRKNRLFTQKLTVVVVVEAVAVP